MKTENYYHYTANDSKLRVVNRYGYESINNVYDIEFYDGTKTAHYFVNCRPSERLPIHVSIEKHFEIQQKLL